MRNKLTDVHDHLVAELERLGDESLTGQKLLEEIARAHAVSEVAARVTANADLILKGRITANKSVKLQLPKLLTE
jgi:hypothetical protein